MNKKIILTTIFTIFSANAQIASATCDDIFAAVATNPSSVSSAVGQSDSGGYGLPMWISAVDETGKVCAVVNTAGSGALIGNKSWLGSRVIAVQKATAANAFSLDIFSIATANLYGLTLPGGSLYGLQMSNPVDSSQAYQGNPDLYGAANDPLVGQRIGGINVFGGGLALYKDGKKVGAVGVSGDTSCTDHAVAWKIRQGIGLDSVPGGFIKGYTPAPSFAIKGDEMIIGKADVTNTYKQVSCAHNAIKNPTAGAANGVIIE